MTVITLYDPTLLISVLNTKKIYNATTNAVNLIKTLLVFKLLSKSEYSVKTETTITIVYNIPFLYKNNGIF